MLPSLAIILRIIFYSLNTQNNNNKQARVRETKHFCNSTRDNFSFILDAKQYTMTSVEGSRNLVLLIIFNLLILTHSLAVNPKLDFGDKRELVEVRKDIKTGKIKGLRVTVDTSELKGDLKIIQ